MAKQVALIVLFFILCQIIVKLFFWPFLKCSTQPSLHLLWALNTFKAWIVVSYLLHRAQLPWVRQHSSWSPFGATPYHHRDRVMFKRFLSQHQQNHSLQSGLSTQAGSHVLLLLCCILFRLFQLQWLFVSLFIISSKGSSVSMCRASFLNILR